MVNRAAGVTYLTHSHSHMDDGERQSEQDSFICTAGVKRGKFLDNFNLEETALKYLVTCGFHKTLHFLFLLLFGILHYHFHPTVWKLLHELFDISRRNIDVETYSCHKHLI